MSARKPLPEDPSRLVCAEATLGLSLAGDDHLLTATFGSARSDQVTLWASTTGEKLGSFGTGTGVVCWYAERSSAGLVAAGFGDCTLRTWNPRTAVTQTLATLPGIRLARLVSRRRAALHR